MYKVDVLLAVEKAAILLACAGTFSLLIFIAVSAYAISTPRPFDRIAAVTGAAFVFGTLGMVIGMTMAASRVPVVGAVLPGVLTFIGAVALFVITRKEGDVATVTSSVAAFSVLLFLGTVLGSFERDRALAEADAARHDLPRLKWEADTEFAIGAYRDSLGLPPLDWAPAKPPADKP